MTALHQTLCDRFQIRRDQPNEVIAGIIETDYECASPHARQQLIAWLRKEGVTITGVPSSRAIAQLVLDALTASAATSVDQRAASARFLELAEARAKETGAPLTAVLIDEVARQHPGLADRVSGGPYHSSGTGRPRSTSMDGQPDRNEPGADAHNPAPTRPATALGTAEEKIRQHLAITGQTNRLAAIRNLLSSGLSTEVKDALRKLLDQEQSPSATLHELTLERMRERNIEYKPAMQEIAAENMALAERAAALPS